MHDMRSERILGPYHRPDRGEWYLIHQLPDPDARSGCVRQTLRFASEGEAQREAARLRGAIVAIVHTVETAMTDFLDERRSEGVKPRTLDGYREAILRWWPEPDRVVLAGLKSSDERTRYRELTHRYSVDTHRGTLKQCKFFLKWCRRKALLQTNPLAEIDGVGARSYGKAQLRRDEARRLYAWCLGHAHDDRAVITLLALVCGLRAGEILALEARDIDDGGALLHVSDAKTRAGVRTVEVPEPLQEILSGLAGRHGVQGDPATGFSFFPDETPTRHLFPGHWRDYPRHCAAYCCTLAGVPVVSAHGLRGTHASLARSAGTSSQVVAGTLGHASPAVTERHYIDREETERQKQRSAFKVLQGGK